MMFRGSTVTVACLLAPLLAFPLLARTALAQNNQQLKNASVQLSTGDDGKKEASVITVTVTNADGKLLERVLDNKLDLKPDTSMTLWLNRASAATADKLKDSRITFTVTPKGDEHWVVKDARLRVNFENGPGKTWHWGPFTLDSKDSKPASVEFPLTDDQH